MLIDSQPLFYLELNDDSLIRDLVSGVYTGSPEARDIQNLYPFGAFVSLFYRALPDVPWYGIILFFLQALCMFILLFQALRAAAHTGGKPGGAAGVTAVWLVLAALVAPHFLFLQYSVTAGLLVCTAAFLIVTAKDGRGLFVAVLLVGVAFTIRSELVLLLSPMVFLALLFSYIGELTRKRAENEELPAVREFIMYPFRTDRYRRYGMAFIGLILAIALGWNADRIGYADAGWHEFVRFFNARTEVYDFTGIPEYQGNEAFYDSLGLSEQEVDLLENYDFGLSDDIDADAMEAVAKYAGERLEPSTARLRRAFSDYLYRLRHLGFPESLSWPQTDAPWNVFVIILYITLFIMTFIRSPKVYGGGKRVGTALWRPLLLFACRSVLWLYLMMRGRDPVRITDPLYFTELAVLFGLIITQSGRESRAVVREDGTADSRLKAVAVPRFAVALAAMAVGFVYIGGEFGLMLDELGRRQQENAAYEELHAYASKNNNNWYFLDVYSSVRETRPLFSEAKKTGEPDNLDLIGGWAVKSPAWAEKLSIAGYDSAFSGLLSGDAFFVSDSDRDISWLEDYYRSEGVEIELRQEEVVADTFAIYSVSRAGD